MLLALRLGNILCEMLASGEAPKHAAQAFTLVASPCTTGAARTAPLPLYSLFWLMHNGKFNMQSLTTGVLAQLTGRMCSLPPI